jgi:uroporphyrinogen-III decarboxylase
MASAWRSGRLCRSDVLSFAATGLRMPIGTDLVLQEREDAQAIVHDPDRLADVVLEAAARYRTPFAMPLMDLRLEQEDLVSRLRPGEPAERFRFSKPPEPSDLARARDTDDDPFPPRQRAQHEAIARVAERSRLVPVGMTIGPFSLLSRLLADPIAAVALAGSGLDGEDEPLVAAAEGALELATATVERSLRAQLAAGASIVMVCEPAASTAYVSPLQLAAGSPVFERFVVEPLLRLKSALDAAGALLFLHDCGELVDPMLEALASRVRPAVLSLGSSRRLWEDVRLVPPDVVLFGNLPTKHFHSDAALPLDRVRTLTRELAVRMRETGHPFILGSECDVLHVPGCSDTIRRKVELMLSEAAPCSSPRRRSRASRPGPSTRSPAAARSSRSRRSPRSACRR